MTTFVSIGSLTGSLHPSLSGVLTKRKTVLNCPLHGDYEAEGIYLGSILKTQTKCPQCEEDQREAREAVEAVMRQEAIKKEVEERVAKSRVPLEYRSKSFDSFRVLNAEQGKALELSKRFIRGWEKAKAGGYGLLFLGSCGTGKTHLACSIVAALIANHQFLFPKYYRTSEIFSAVRKSYVPGSQTSEDEVLNYFSGIELLVIDEVGVQKGSDAERRILFSILDTRMTSNKPTILLSNLSAEGLCSLLGDRLYDRVRSKCVPALFVGQSMRRPATPDLFD